MAGRWQVDGAAPLQQGVVLAAANAMAARGLRVLALARRTHAALPDVDKVESVESGMSLIGLVRLIDPPRTEAAAAVRDCQTAGITP